MADGETRVERITGDGAVPHVVKTYDPAEPLISLHVPKTAGTSLRDALDRWFPDGRLRLHYGGDVHPPTRHALRGGDCVHGHFNRWRGFGLAEYYPEATQCIVFLRDPFERFVSLWRYQNARKRAGVPVPMLDDVADFATFFESRVRAMADDPLAGSMYAQLPEAALADPRFVFVGLTERYEESLRALAVALGKPALPATHANASARDGDFSSWRAAYERAFPGEVELYRAACVRHERDVRTYRG